MADLSKRPVFSRFDSATGEMTHTEATDAEWDQMKADAEAEEEARAAREAADLQRIADADSAKAKFIEMGLTEDEIAALGLV
tara:strand:+ start:209 stop:454 length:246 start_codon:yes stop_codon:yes gene_type:complete